MRIFCKNLLATRLNTMAIICMVLLLASKFSHGAITLQYTDPWDNTVHPLEGAVVKVFLTTGVLKWTSSPSDASGSVSIDGVVPQIIGYSQVVYTTVSASNGSVRIIPGRSCFTEVIAYLLGVDPSLFPVVRQSTGTGLSSTINVADGYIPVLLDMGNKAQAVSTSKFSYTPPRLDIYYDPCLYSGDGWIHFTGLGGTIWSEIGSVFAGTNATFRKQYLFDKDWTRRALAHEYGHYVHYKLNGSQTLPGGGDHTIYSKGNASLAFFEGWAEFYSEYVMAKNALSSGLSYTENFPQANPLIRGSDQESHVAAFFWDLFDNDVPSGQDENVTGDVTRAKAMFGNHYSNIQQYHDYWMSFYPSDIGFDDIYMKTFFHGFPGFMPPIPTLKMVFNPAQTVNGTIITKAFFISSTETTQGEYYDVMNSFPSQYSAVADFTMPVGSVNWYDAILYCNALSSKRGLPMVYSYDAATFSGIHCTSLTNLKIDLSKSGYRLPTKEEWTWAYKAGTTTPYYWGAQQPDNFAWYNANSGGKPHPVGGKTPNANGLYDMGGNIMEWVWTGVPDSEDRSGMGGYFSSTQATGSCLMDNATTCVAPPTWMSSFNGFRVARNYTYMPYMLLLE